MKMLVTMRIVSILCCIALLALNVLSWRRPVCLNDTAGISNSTNVRLTRQKSALFQWLAVPLWFPPDKDSLPTDSGHSAPVLLDPAARLERGARWVNS